ncbi:tudor domain-containing 6 [Halichoeres trimaculatus]|uniref:tudor domain-containing 6 n=1 Tax=Halichoeres trimaculatus TaxID=147232 RepID=UPI003D9DCE3C
MCSIPGLPTPGSEVSVLITRVNQNHSCGLVELWVNIEPERKPIYTQMKEEIQIPLRKFGRGEGKPADLCLVCISDIWHRARIVSSEGGTYKVFLIDQGQPHITTSDALAWGQSDSFLLPPEIESCILANVHFLKENWPDRASNFLKSLHGKTVKGLVQHVLMPDRVILLDIPVVSKQICKSGAAKKIPADEFKCLVQEHLILRKGVTPEAHLNAGLQIEKNCPYFYPELLTGAFETVHVTEVNNPHSISCQIQIFTKAIKTVSEHIQLHCEGGSDIQEAQPRTCGDPCAARGKTSRWHRSLLKENMKSSGTVEVFQVDEGKTELIPVDDIKPMGKEFLRMPVFTYQFSLDGVENEEAEWTTEQIEYLKSLLLNQTVVAKLNSHDTPQDVYNVTLYASDGVCINSNFKEKMGLLSPFKNKQESKAPNASLPVDSHGDEGSVNLSKDKDVDVLSKETVPKIKNPQINGRTDNLNSHDVIYTQESYKQLDPIVPSNGHHQADFHCVRQNANDSGVFTTGRSINVKVSCIESLQKFWCQMAENNDSLHLLMKDLQNYYASTHPEPLVESICVARNPDDNMWYRARIIASHHSPVVDVRFIDYGPIRRIPLRDVRPIDPAFLRLHAKAFQCCLLDPKNPSNPTATPGNGNALGELLKFVDSGVLSETGLKCTFKAVTTDEEGLPLYVVDIESSSEWACKLTAEKVAQHESQIQCNETTQKHWKTAATEHVETENTQIENLKQDGQTKLDSTHLSVSKGNVNTFLFKKPNIPRNQKVEVYASSVAEPHYFWCQYANTEELHKISRLVLEAGQVQQKDMFPQTLVPGSPCLALFPSDEQWYRAQVMNRADDAVNVVFIDYGNESDINIKNVRPIPQTLLDAAPQAFLCCLDGFDVSKGSWDDKAFDDFYNLMVDKPLKLRVTNMGDHSDIHVPHYAVEIECEGLVVNAAMKKYWKKSSEESVTQKPLQTETLLSESQIGSKTTYPSFSKGNVNTLMYKEPEVSKSKAETMFASCIVEPHYFWCQFANTEKLNKVTQLAQEAGQTQHDEEFLKTLDPGSPCLALFPSDEQWYRAQVINRVDDAVNVVFIDYGNESDIGFKNVRPIPQALLDAAPQALLCSLEGFDVSKGSWDDQVYDDFYSILVDKPLRVTVLSMHNHKELAIPQVEVEVECDGVVVNEMMKKYWKGLKRDHFLPGGFRSGQDEK